MKEIKSKQIFMVVFAIGFVLGILYLNLLAVDYLSVTGVFNSYYLGEFQELELDQKAYWVYLAKVRIIPLIFIVIFMYSQLRRVSVIGYFLWIGFLFGIYMSMGILQMGGSGILICIVGILPQMLFYIPAYLIVLFLSFDYPQSHWTAYKIIMIILLMFSGIIMELQINPILLKGVIKMCL